MMIRTQVICAVIVFILFAMGCAVTKNSEHRSKIRQRHLQGMFFHPKKENQRRIANFNEKSDLKIQRQKELDFKVFHKGNGINNRPLIRQPAALNSGIFLPKLPNHYTNLNARTSPLYPEISRSTSVTRGDTFKTLPVFEQNNDDNTNLNINFYRNHRRNSIFKSVMSDKPFPMYEPVPGQVLYPPNSPNFRPVPVTADIQQTNQSQFRPYSFVNFLNTTQKLIPFYAHEATDSWTSTTTLKPLQNSSTLYPTIIYASPYPTYNESDQFISNFTQPRKYKAFTSKDAVTIRPLYQRYSTFRPNIESTPYANLQISAPGNFKNHRVETTTAMSRYLPVSSHQSDQDIHESKKVHSALYGGFRSRSPMAIYTLSKLLQRQKYSAMYNKNHTTKKFWMNFTTTDSNFSEAETTTIQSDIQRSSPKRTRQVSSIFSAVPIEPNFSWVVMDNSYVRQSRSGNFPLKHSSNFKASGFNSYSKKFVPKRHGAYTALGAQILVQG